MWKLLPKKSNSLAPLKLHGFTKLKTCFMSPRRCPRPCLKVTSDYIQKLFCFYAKRSNCTLQYLLLADKVFLAFVRCIFSFREIRPLKSHSHRAPWKNICFYTHHFIGKFIDELLKFILFWKAFLLHQWKTHKSFSQ